MKNKNPRNLSIYITGTGLLSSAGKNVEENWQTILSGKNNFSLLDKGIHCGKLSNELNLKLEELRKDKILSLMDRTVLMAILASRQAIKHISSQQLSNALVIIGSSRGPVNALEERHETFLKTGEVEKYFSMASIYSSMSAGISRDMGSVGPSFTVSAACSSGIHSIGMGAMMLQSGYGKNALVGGTESPITPFLTEQFKVLGILALNQSGPYPCRPMDPTRVGTVLGEGASCLFLQVDPSCKPLGVVRGVDSALENGLKPRLSEKAESLQAAITKAVENAELDLKQIDMIIGHGSGTQVGDEGEWECYKALFGKNMPPLVQHKWSISHMMGAHTSASVALACKHIATGFIPKHPYMPESHPMGREYHKEIKNVLVTSLAVGGNAGALVISKPE